MTSAQLSAIRPPPALCLHPASDIREKFHATSLYRDRLKRWYVAARSFFLLLLARPGPAWVLLSKIYTLLIRSLYPPGFPQLYSRRNSGGVSDMIADVLGVWTVRCRARCRVAAAAAVPSRIKLGEPRGTLPVSLPHPNTAPSLPQGEPRPVVRAWLPDGKI